MEIDGAWYHVDTTWDDPINRGGDFIRYDYFLKSDAYMRRDHASWTADHVYYLISLALSYAYIRSGRWRRLKI